MYIVEILKTSFGPQNVMIFLQYLCSHLCKVQQAIFACMAMFICIHFVFFMKIQS